MTPTPPPWLSPNVEIRKIWMDKGWESKGVVDMRTQGWTWDRVESGLRWHDVGMGFAEQAPGSQDRFLPVRRNCPRPF